MISGWSGVWPGSVLTVWTLMACCFSRWGNWQNSLLGTFLDCGRKAANNGPLEYLQALTLLLYILFHYNYTFNYTIKDYICPWDNYETAQMKTYSSYWRIQFSSEDTDNH